MMRLFGKTKIFDVLQTTRIKMQTDKIIKSNVISKVEFAF